MLLVYNKGIATGSQVNADGGCPTGDFVPRAQVLPHQLSTAQDSSLELMQKLGRSRCPRILNSCKKLRVTMASLLATRALLLVARSYYIQESAKSLLLGLQEVGEVVLVALKGSTTLYYTICNPIEILVSPPSIRWSRLLRTPWPGPLVPTRPGPRRRRAATWPKQTARPSSSASRLSRPRTHPRGSSWTSSGTHAFL